MSANAVFYTSVYNDTLRCPLQSGLDTRINIKQAPFSGDAQHAGGEKGLGDLWMAPLTLAFLIHLGQHKTEVYVLVRGHRRVEATRVKRWTGWEKLQHR